MRPKPLMPSLHTILEKERMPERDFTKRPRRKPNEETQLTRTYRVLNSSLTCRYTDPRTRGRDAHRDAVACGAVVSAVRANAAGDRPVHGAQRRRGLSLYSRERPYPE